MYVRTYVGTSAHFCVQNARTHTHTHTHAHRPTDTCSHRPTHTHTHSHRPTHSHAHRPTLTLTQAHTLTLTQAHALTLTQAHTLTLTQAHTSLHGLLSVDCTNQDIDRTTLGLDSIATFSLHNWTTVPDGVGAIITADMYIRMCRSHVCLNTEYAVHTYICTYVRTYTTVPTE